MLEHDRIQQNVDKKASRRIFLGTGAAVAVAALLRLRHTSFTVEAKDVTPRDVRIGQFTSSGQREGVITVKTIVKTDAEWKAQLSSDAFEVTRGAGTEPPYSSPLESVHDKGVFTCACCQTALFNADTKFESGTGWPSSEFYPLLSFPTNQDA